jgi:hypothetical protein
MKAITIAALILCRYCGRPAGLFRSQHPDCADRHNRALVMALRDTTAANER